MLATWDAVSVLDRMFDDVMGAALGAATNPRPFSLDVDVRASEDEVLVVCDVPGVKLEDIEITLEDRVLTIKGTRRFESKDNEQVMLGRSYGTFARRFPLPDSLDESNLAARLADGVLTVTIPKHPRARPLRIPIGAEAEPKRLKE